MKGKSIRQGSYCMYQHIFWHQLTVVLSLITHSSSKCKLTTDVNIVVSGFLGVLCERDHFFSWRRQYNYLKDLFLSYLKYNLQNYKWISQINSLQNQTYCYMLFQLRIKYKLFVISSFHQEKSCNAYLWTLQFIQWSHKIFLRREVSERCNSEK